MGDNGCQMSAAENRPQRTVSLDQRVRVGRAIEGWERAKEKGREREGMRGIDRREDK